MPAEGGPGSVIDEPGSIGLIMTQKTYTDVPPADVGKTVQRFVRIGTVSITCTPQADGNWTIVIMKNP